MKFSLSTPKQRIAAALVISFALHVLLLGLPRVELYAPEPDLPPLIATLQPVARAAKSPAVKKPKRAPQSKSKSPATPPVTENDSVVEIANGVDQDATDPVASISVNQTETLDNTSPAAETGSASDVLPAPPPRPPLPKNARLKFEVRMGSNGLVVGETVHTLEFDDNQYKLTSTTRTIGLARLLKQFSLSQTSWGMSDGQILSPRKYTEEKIDDNENYLYQATFDRYSNKLILGNGSEVPLQAETQDMLSILYQFPPLPAEGDVLPITVTNGRSVEQYLFEVTTNEILNTRMGKLHTVHFRKQQVLGKPGLEIWFAQEYRLLPVKLRHIEPNGDISGEAVITEILVSDN